MAKCLRCGAGNEWIKGNVKKAPIEEYKKKDAEIEDCWLKINISEKKCIVMNDELIKKDERIKELEDGYIKLQEATVNFMKTIPIDTYNNVYLPGFNEAMITLQKIVIF